MTRLSTFKNIIELANTDTQLMVSTCADGLIEVFLSEDDAVGVTHESAGLFEPKEFKELVRLLYVRYVLDGPLMSELMELDAK